MDSKKIIVPVDFTVASEQATAQAIIIARKTGNPVRLIHITGNGLSGMKNPEEILIEDKLNKLAGQVIHEGIRCDYITAHGNIFDEIPVIANHTDNYMLVIGTHGIQGLKQKMFGADILRIVRKVSIPCLVVQEKCVSNNFNPIVFPVGGHEGFRRLIEDTAAMATLFGAEVHIYSIVRKGEQDSEKIIENTLLAEKIFNERSVTYRRIKEDPTIVSVGYARQTLEYAHRNSAGLISIMSVKSDEHYYFAQADKETMINNAYNIPVMCASGLINY